MGLKPAWSQKAKNPFLWHDDLQKRTLIMPFHSTELSPLLTSLIDEETVLQIAKETGSVERQRKFQPFVFVWCLLLGFATGTCRNQAGFRRTYNQRPQNLH